MASNMADMGRPPVDPERGPKDAQTLFKHHSADKAKWQAAAKRDGFPDLTAWIVAKLNAAAKKSRG